MDAHDKQGVIEPAHYRAGGLEVIEIIEAFGLDFCKGNALKYLLRAGKKPGADARVDLLKCIWFLNRAITQAETTTMTEAETTTMTEAETTTMTEAETTTMTEGAGRTAAFIL